MKRKLAIILLSSLALSLVACGKDKDKTTETTEIGGLTEVTTTESVQDTTEQGYVAPPSNSNSMDNIIVEDYIYASEERYLYTQNGFYKFETSLGNLGCLEFCEYEDNSGYVILKNPYTLETITFTTVHNSTDALKVQTASNMSDYQVKTDWVTETYNNVSYEHISYDMGNDTTSHTFIHQRKDGLAGIITFYVIFDEEWQIAMNSMEEISFGEITDNTEVTTEVQESETSETAE